VLNHCTEDNLKERPRKSIVVLLGKYMQICFSCLLKVENHSLFRWFYVQLLSFIILLKGSSCHNPFEEILFRSKNPDINLCHFNISGMFWCYLLLGGLLFILQVACPSALFFPGNSDVNMVILFQHSTYVILRKSVFLTQQVRFQNWQSRFFFYCPLCCKISFAL
jgi:hypothetical protein